MAEDIPFEQQGQNCANAIAIQRGIQLKRNSDAVFAARLQRWLDDLQSLYGERILPINTAITRRWGTRAQHVSLRLISAVERSPRPHLSQLNGEAG